MKTCIIGYGAIGKIHAKILVKTQGVKLYSICDINKERADEGARKYGIKAQYSFEDCIKDPDIDCVHICTPHYLHFDMITKALDSGKRVVVEKPAVMKKSELDRLFLEYDVSKIYPIVQNRTNPCVQRMRDIIKNEDCGKLKGVKGILTWNRDKSYYDEAKWRGTKAFEGGGVLINQAVHTIDLMSCFAGKAKTVEATVSNKSLKDIIEVEDTVEAFIEFENGAKGVFYATNAYADNSSMQVELVFEKKLLQYINGKLFVDDEYICTDRTDFIGKRYWGSGHECVMEDYYVYGSDFCLNDVSNTMYTLFAIYESAEKGMKINTN